MNRSVFYGVAAAACWGFTNVLSKFLLAKFEPLFLLGIQLLTSNVLLWLFLAFRGKSPLSRIENLKYSLPGLLQPGLAYIFGVFGLNLTTADSESLIWTIETIVIIFLASLLLRERINWYLLMLAGCGIGGTLMATMGNFDTHFNASVCSGNLLVLGGVFCAAFYSIYSQRQLVDIEPLRLIALHQLSGLVLVTGIWLAFLPLLGVSFNLSALDFLLAIISGITGYALPFFLYLLAIKGIGAAKTSILLVLPPVFTIWGSFIVLGERLNCFQGMGVFLALLAVGGICILKSTSVAEKIVVLD